MQSLGTTVFFAFTLAFLYSLLSFRNAGCFYRKLSATDKSLKQYQQSEPTTPESQMSGVTVQEKLIYLFFFS